MFKHSMAHDIPAPRMTTNHDQFLAQGDPWCTERDWRWEANLSTNPMVATRLRESAADFTRPAKANQPRPSRRVPAPRPIPVSDEVRLKRQQRETLKQVLREIQIDRPARVEDSLPQVRHVYVGKLERDADAAQAVVQAQARWFGDISRAEWLRLARLGAAYVPGPFAVRQIVAVFGSLANWREEATRRA